MMDKKDSWAEFNLSRGYSQGPNFSSYETLLAWDSTNKRPHIRQIFDGDYRVFFTDGQPYSSPKSEPIASIGTISVQKKKVEKRAPSGTNDEDWMKNTPF